MKKTVLIAMIAGCTIFGSSPVWAHDGGHGPQLTDTGMFGGLMTAVVEAKDASKGAAAALVYKGELTRSADKTVRVYVYGTDMKLLPAAHLDAKATAMLIATVGGKETATPFPLVLEKNAYVGKMPEPAGTPYNIDVRFRAGSRELLAAFDGLD